MKGNVVDAGPTRAHIKALMQMGWKHAEIARAANVNRGQITAIVSGGRHLIGPDAAFRICCVNAGQRTEYVKLDPDVAHERARKAALSISPEAAQVRGLKSAQTRRDKQQRAVAKAIKEDALTIALQALRAKLYGDEDEDDDKWRDRALCAQVDPDLFFPEKGGPSRDAKQLCLSCPVKDPCLEFAMASEERFGIWGAMSERERRRLERGAA